MKREEGCVTCVIQPPAPFRRRKRQEKAPVRVISPNKAPSLSRVVQEMGKGMIRFTATGIACGQPRKLSATKNKLHKETTCVKARVGPTSSALPSHLLRDRGLCPGAACFSPASTARVPPGAAAATPLLGDRSTRAAPPGPQQEPGLAQGLPRNTGAAANKRHAEEQRHRLFAHSPRDSCSQWLGGNRSCTAPAISFASRRAFSSCAPLDAACRAQRDSGRGQGWEASSGRCRFDRHRGGASDSCLLDSLRALPRGTGRQQVGRRVWTCLVLSILKEAWSWSTDGLRRRRVQGSVLMGQKEPLSLGTVHSRGCFSEANYCPEASGIA